MIRKIRRSLNFFSTFHVFITSREGKMKFRPKSSLKSELEELLRLFEGLTCPIFLVGGVGLAVRKKQFYRNHKDFDFAIFTEDFDELSEFLKSKGFRMTTRWFTTKISKDRNFDIYKSIKSLNKHEHKGSKLITKIINLNRPRSFFIRARLDMMDLLLFSKSEKGVIAHGYHTTIPWQDFYPLETLSEKSSIFLPNIKYKKYFLPKTRRQQDDLIELGLRPNE